MRVIAGSAKGHKLVAPPSNRTRPVLDQVKEAIFNILFDVTDLRVGDFFAGSGAVGIEALSRGARDAVFVESWSPAVEVIRRNLAHTRLEDRAIVIARPVDIAIAQLGRQGRRFDLIFVDPPYERDLVGPTLERIAEQELLAPAGRIVVEHHPKEPIQAPPGLVLTDTRKYGQTRISFLEPTSKDISS